MGFILKSSMNWSILTVEKKRIKKKNGQKENDEGCYLRVNDIIYYVVYVDMIKQN